MLSPLLLSYLHVVEKSQSEETTKASSPTATNGPITKLETNYQPITKSHTNANHLLSQPVSPHRSLDSVKSVYRTNGPILSGYVPNPPVRNPIKTKYPSSKSVSKSSRPRSSQSAAEQLGVKSPPPIKTNGGIILSYIYDSV